jgi:hypothetical protein
VEQRNLYPADNFILTFFECRLTQRKTMSDARNQKAYDVAPGIWVDREGGAHFDVQALMKLFRIEDTPRNRQEVMEFCEEVLKRQMPAANVIVRHDAHEHNQLEHEF